MTSRRNFRVRNCTRCRYHIFVLRWTRNLLSNISNGHFADVFNFFSLVSTPCVIVAEKLNLILHVIIVKIVDTKTKFSRTFLNLFQEYLLVRLITKYKYKMLFLNFRLLVQKKKSEFWLSVKCRKYDKHSVTIFRLPVPIGFCWPTV